MVVSLSVLVGCILKYQWIYDENVAYNIFVMLRPVTFPSVLNVFDKSLQEQIEHFQKLTETMEQQSQSKYVAKFYGKEYYEASFGQNQTNIVSLFATTRPTTSPPPPPTRATTTKGDDNYSVPIKCTCPYRVDSSEVEKPTLPLVLYYHGGGLLMGSIDGELVWTRWLAQTTNSVVCSVGYRKVPQYAYPIPINDAIYASRSIILKSTSLTLSIEEELNVTIDYNRVATWGMSAGGYIAGHVVRQLLFDYEEKEEEGGGKDKNDEYEYEGVTFKCQFSLVPMVSPFAGTSSLIRYWDRMYSGYEYIYAWSKYLSRSSSSSPPPPPKNDNDNYDHEQDGNIGPLISNWKVSLLVDPPFVSQDTLKEKLPPTYIQIATQDILRDEGEMYVTLSIYFCSPSPFLACVCVIAFTCFSHQRISF